jgi:hypothetical protein
MDPLGASGHHVRRRHTGDRRAQARRQAYRIVMLDEDSDDPAGVFD